MKIKNKQGVVVTGKTICIIAGIICEACGLYWLVQSLVYGNTDLPAMLSSIFLGFYLVWAGTKH